MANLSDLIAQSTSDNPQKLVNLALATQMMGSGSGLGGTNYVFVKGDGTPEENAIELQAAYDLAKTMPRYLGSRDTMTSYSYYKGQTYVDDSLSEHFYYRVLEDFVGTHDGNPTKVESITETEALSTKLTVVVAPGQYKFGETAFIVDTPYINIVSLTGNADVLLDGINVTANNVYLKGLNCGSNTFTIADNLDGLVCENCTGGVYSFGGYGGTASGTFTGCIGGGYSFGGGAGTASGTFTGCIGGVYSFGGGYGGTASGTFTGCIGGGYSFGGAGSITGDAKLYFCKLTVGVFMDPDAGGKLVLCIDGNDNVVTTS